MTNFYVIDSIMGNGKTSAMIHLLQGAEYDSDHYVVVVPLLTEVERWKAAFDRCGLNPVAPKSGVKNKTKMADLKELLRHHAQMIIVTHSLLDRFDTETTDLLREGNYTLVIDEVPTPVRRLEMKKGDIAAYLAAGIISVDKDTRRVSWNADFADMETSFDDVRDLCKTGNVVYSPSAKAIYRVSSYDIYFACKSVYILTYMFEAQIVYYYLAQRNVQYKKFSAYYDEECGYYCLCEYSPIFDKTSNWRELIRICDHKRMNAVGEKRNALSVNWFGKNPGQCKILKKNVFNFSRNMCKAKCNDILWTTYMDYQDDIASNGFKKSFLAVNAKATNDFSDRTVVSYIANCFVSPDIRNYFNINDKNLKFDEDAYALSEMLQFIWRSAIRTGKPINLYIPSSRMRGLLEKWIEENSVPA
jgi:hypothetical protein